MHLTVAAATLGRVVGRCVHCHNQVHAEPSLIFYQTAAAVFAVLLLTGVAGEIRDLRSRINGQPQPLSKPWRAYLAGVAGLMLLSISGELLSLAVILTRVPHTAEQIAVAACLVLAVPGIPLLMLLSLWEDRLRELMAIARTVLVVFLIAAIGAGLSLLTTAFRTSPSVTYNVFGTCVAGSCGLNERRRPTIHSQRLGQLQDGDIVRIVCQVKGGKVTTPEGVTSRIWDKLTNGHYVSDVSVDTPPVGSQIPAC
jgi:hypothetical protein